MSIREDYEKDYTEKFGKKLFESDAYEELLWTAEWTIEKCALKCEALYGGIREGYVMADLIRSLAQELSR